MSLTFKYLTKTTGMALTVVGIAMIPSLAVSLIYHETSIALDFLKLFPVAIIIGLVMLKRFKHSLDRLVISDGLLIVIWGWIIAILFGCLPYIISGASPSVIDGVFESCSGFTTTGATTFTDVEAVPHGLLFWRSTTSWLGGIAILLIAIPLFPSLGLSGQSIVSTEINGPILEKPTPYRKKLSYTLICIYLSLTLAEIILLCLGGMGGFDAVIHSFGSVSTGGFSSHNESIAFFGGTYIKVVITIFMVLCGVNFNLYFNFLRRGFSALHGESELRLYAFLILISSVIVILGLEFGAHAPDVDNVAVDSVFQTASILTTTGYTVGNYENWPQICQAVLLFLMFVGACSSSAGGGLKVIRLVMLAKLIGHGISMRLHPQYYEAIKVNRNRVSPDVMSGVCNYTLLYASMVVLGSIAVSFETNDMMTAFTSVVSCIGNIGPCFEVIGSSGCYESFGGFSKTILSLLMIAGRLELYTFFILFSPHYWTQKY